MLIRVEQQPGGEGEQQVGHEEGGQDALGDELHAAPHRGGGTGGLERAARTGFIAVAASMLAIMVYVWFRFEWQFAVGAIVALTHDVLVTVGMFSLLQMRVRSVDRRGAADHSRLFGERHAWWCPTASARTCASYKRMDLERAAQPVDQRDAVAHDPDRSSRRIAVLALYIFGGEVIRNFSFAMLFGIVIGTYSSIFIAAPLAAATSASSATGAAPAGQGAGQGAKLAAKPPRRENVAMRNDAPHRARYPGRAPIDAYGNGGFRFAEMSHRGSILCLPSGIYAWAARARGIARHACARLGRTGRARSAAARHRRDARSCRRRECASAFAAAGRRARSMDTGAACRTYNVLLAEARPVGAALIAGGAEASNGGGRCIGHHRQSAGRPGRRPACSRLLLLLGSAASAGGRTAWALLAFLVRCVHVLAAMIWIGLVFFVNFVQLVALRRADEAVARRSCTRPWCRAWPGGSGTPRPWRW